MKRSFVVLAVAAFAAGAVWRLEPVLLEPGPAGTFDEVAVKDPSIVRYKDRWHLFYSARNKTDYSLGYVSAPRLEEIGKSPRRQLGQLHSERSKYAAAPQVFYFRPRNKWYLVYQTNDSNYQPVYSTTTDIDDPASWTPARPLVAKNEQAKWIDFWVICDDRQAYLFFTRNHSEVVVMTTPLADFPAGFSGMRAVFSPVHEAVHVYSLAGRYVMVYEQRDGDLRHFGLARATSPGGPWTRVQERFADGVQLEPGSAAKRWTDEVSHGELLRSGSDERLGIAPGEWRLLIQGMPRERHRGAYPLLPWRLGLIVSAMAPE